MPEQESASLQNTPVRQTDMLQYLHETTLDIMRQRNHKALLELILVRAAYIAGTDSGCMLLYDETRSRCHVELAIGQAAFFQNLSFPIEEGASGEVWRTGKPYINHDYRHYAHALDCVRELLTAVAYFPLTSNGQAVGVIGLWQLQNEPIFGEETIRNLQQLFALASLAYETCSNYSEAQHEIEERRHAENLQHALYRISEAAALSQSTNELYSQMHQIIADLIPAENFYIALYDAKNNTLCYPYYIDQFDSLDSESIWPLENSMTEYVIRKGEPVFIQQVEYEKLLAAGEIAAIGARPLDWLGIPLFNSKGAIIGALVVQTYDQGVRYTKQHEHILSFVSRQIANAIERKLTAQALLESEEKYRAIVESTRDIIFIYSDHKILFANQRLCAEMGYTPEQALQMDPLDFFVAAERERIAGYVADRIADKPAPHSYEATGLRSDGKEIPFEISVCKLNYKEHEAFLGIAHDISRRKLSERLQNALYRISETAGHCAGLQELYAAVHSIISDLVRTENFFIALYDAETDCISSTYYVDQNDHPPLPEEFRGSMTEYVIRSGQPLMAPWPRRLELASQGLFHLLGSTSKDWLGVPLRSADNRTLGALVVQSYDQEICYSEQDRDILTFVSTQVAMVIERKIAEEKLLYFSSHDALTGFYNRSAFELELQRLSEACELPLSLVICDIDGLKLANDALGHAAGDKLLKKAAEVLRLAFGQYSFIARIGGDEFAVILQGVDVGVSTFYQERLQRFMHSHNQNQETIQLSMSAGSAVMTEPGKKISELFREADNHMYREKLHRSQSTRSSLVNAMMKLLEARDFITEGHGDRMQDLAVILAKASGMSKSSIADIRLLAQFHDIGKVGIPDQILFKPGPLSPEEKIEMQRHCEIGYRIARSSNDLLPIADCILKHHEWWNGQGYPLEISGEEIPLACRIISIVDAYDAMTNNRPYRQALDVQSALDQLKRGAGSQFDPELVKLFISCLKQSG